MRIRPDDSLLLVVDLQQALLPAIDGGEAIVEAAGWLLDVAAQIGIPSLATEHCPQRIGLTDARLRRRFSPERLIGKTHFSAVSEGALLAAPAAARQQWVVIGTEAHVCVQQTVLDLLAAGREVFVVDEAVGSRRGRDKALALQRMQQNGAEIVSREMVAFEWLQDANSPVFRDVLKRFIR